jgi:Uncharacterized conserved protein
MTAISGERFVHLEKGDGLFTIKDHKIVPVTFEKRTKDGSYFVYMHSDYCHYSSDLIAPCRLFETEVEAAKTLIKHDEDDILTIQKAIDDFDFKVAKETERQDSKYKRYAEDSKKEIENVKADAKRRVENIEARIAGYQEEKDNEIADFILDLNKENERHEKEIENLTFEIQQTQKNYLGIEPTKKGVKK